jgi:hypothetical protein
MIAASARFFKILRDLSHAWFALCREALKKQANSLAPAAQVHTRL